MRGILILLTILCCFQGKAQFYAGKRIAKMPANFRHPTVQTKDPSGKTDATAWIVFSDREDSYTTTTPGGSLIFKKLNFMQPFFVSDEKEGYLRLVKYDPSILKGTKVQDKRKAISYGWIPRHKVLMWQKALTDERTLFPIKAVTIINGADPIARPKFYFSHDSVVVFNSPELQAPAAEKLKLHDLIYIYKFSEDGRKALVGHRSQLTADSAAAAMAGWVSADAVHLWGSRLYVGTSRVSGYDEDSAAARYFRSMLTPEKPSGGNFEYDPLLQPGNPVFRTIPVMQHKGLAVQTKPFRSSVANNVFDKSSNTVINIRGSRIDYNNYLRLRRFGNRVNIMFVVDGGSSMKNYLPGITNTIQNFADVFGKKAFSNYEYRFGAIVYRGSDGCYQNKGMNTFEPTGNYSRIVDFINQQAAITQQCSGIVADQPYYEGLQQAINVLKKYPMQTNIIIVAGSTGNIKGSVANVDGLTRGLVETDARLLVFQVYNKFDPSFNNFVLESRELLEKAAQQQAESKKLRMVKGEGLAVTQQFNTAYTDSVSYYLNYPDGSLIPGAIVFPGRGAVKTNREMMVALNRFLNEVYTDNRQIITSLDSVFMTSGRLREKITEPVMNSINQPGVSVARDFGEHLPHNAFKYYFDVNVKEGIADKGAPVQFAIMLSHDEILQLTDMLSRLAGDNLEQDGSNFRKMLFKSYVKYGSAQWKGDQSKATIKNMKLPVYLERATGMPVDMGPLNSYTVKNICSGMQKEEFEALVVYLRKCNQVLKTQLQTGDYFISNGRPYFYIVQSDWKYGGDTSAVAIAKENE
ncbi:type VI secretion system protein TssR domain-containing protein [Chitinophaga niabensis]|uniref:type VI secretion system protein TssR domain-containing protein n=1 Tax=Chitinophaga niabensis TaxID=536979 RepID=UPI0031BA07AC